MTPAEEPVLCVDLDGTLLATDLLQESFFAAVRRSPMVALQCIAWLIQGRARLKEELACRCMLDVAVLPYREEVLAFLHTERARGRRIVLATASWPSLADAVSRHLGLFDEVLATSRERNLKGEAKARELVERCGEKGFDYLGDSRADYPVWQQARHAYVVDHSGGVASAMPAGVEVRRVFPPDRAMSRPWAALRALRPHQWAKNLLLLAPLIAAHRLGDPSLLGLAVQAVIAFCLVASGTYIANDLLDLAADRAHAQKRTRPLASGALPISWGTILAGLVLAAGAGIAWRLAPGFQAALAAYVVLTLAYSLFLKRIAFLDVVCLATLHTLRIIAGTFAIGVPLSFWLLAFAMFIFFSLALVKRYAELVALGPMAFAPGRGYSGQDAPIVLAFGTASAMVSALVLALYMNGDTVKALYSQPDALWLLCPLLLYWISRMWLLASRGQMNEDPVLFALRDSTSYFVAAAGSFVLWLAT